MKYGSSKVFRPVVRYRKTADSKARLHTTVICTATQKSAILPEFTAFYASVFLFLEMGIQLQTPLPLDMRTLANQVPIPSEYNVVKQLIYFSKCRTPNIWHTH